MSASGTSRAGYIASLDAVKEVFILRHVQDFMEPSMWILHVCSSSGLASDTCGAGKVRVVYIRMEDQPADLFT